MLHQVMSEERATGFTTDDTEGGLKRIVSIGTDPWQVRTLNGRITFNFAEPLRVTALDLADRPQRQISLQNSTLTLAPETVYYLVERP